MLNVLFFITVRELVVSAGKSVEVTLPLNEVKLYAYVVPNGETNGTLYEIIMQFITFISSVSWHLRKNGCVGGANYAWSGFFYAYQLLIINKLCVICAVQ